MSTSASRAPDRPLTDALGSTVGLASGVSVQTHYGYDPYGVAQTTGVASTNPYQFTGRENDQTAAGLMYYRARYYSPAWGRFIAEDPIGIKGGTNLYGYVEQNPANFKDPSGQTTAGALGGAGWGGTAGGALGEILDPLGGAIPGAWIGEVLGAIVGDWWTGPQIWASEEFWDSLQPCKGRPLRTNGLPGKKRRYYEKDKLHGDHLEVYDGRGNHVGEADPNTGADTGPAVPGRSTDVP